MYTRSCELERSIASDSRWRFGETGPCDVTTSTSSNQFFLLEYRTISGNLLCLFAGFVESSHRQVVNWSGGLVVGSSDGQGGGGAEERGRWRES